MRSRWTTGGRRALLAAVLAAALGAAAEAAGQGPAGRRVALVVGNGAYTGVSPLDNPPNDAADVTAALRRLDFDVVSRFDADEDAMDDALAEFEDRSAGADLALVFYAGHGLEMNGANYLVPVDARLDTAAAVRRETIALDSVIDAAAGARTRIVILDACRNNPFARSMRGATRANVRPGGLAAVSTGEGLLVAYAAAAGRVALDGEGSRNSPYTAALLRHLAAPGVEVRVMFGNVGGAVAAATGDQQPFIYTSLTGEHYLGGRPSPTAAGGPAAAGGGGGASASASAAALQAETALWQSIESRPTLAKYEAYLSQYPNGTFAALARLEAAALRSDPPGASGRPPSRPASAADPRPSRRAGERFRDCAECPELVVVPAGSFTMGSPSSEAVRLENEGPQRRVTIPSPLAVGVYEVTRGEFGRFVSATGHATGGRCYSYEDGSWRWVDGRGWRDPGFAQTDDHPVVCVSWEDAQAYVRWLSRETGARYRLLSESEWEYAARGGTASSRYWGSSSSGQCVHANGADSSASLASLGWGVSCSDGFARTSRVGSYTSNGFGLYDVVGNVWEWVEDCWHEDYAGAPSGGSAWTSGGDCGLRVLRGGSWIDDPRLLRSAYRYRNSAGIRDAFGGFRVSRTLD